MEQEVTKKSRRRELRKFGITIGIAFGAFGGLFLLRGKSFYPYFMGIGGAFTLLGVLLPAALGPIQILWMKAARALGWLMTRVILTVLFFVIVTLISILGRLARRDPLKLKFKDGADSYWIPKEQAVRDRSEYERQF
jgi:hypothetical protein